MYSVSYEDPARGFGNMSWSQTQAKHGSNEFCTVIHKVMKENCTGAGHGICVWDGAPTNESLRMVRLQHFVTDARAGNLYIHSYSIDQTKSPPKKQT